VTGDMWTDPKDLSDRMIGVVQGLVYADLDLVALPEYGGRPTYPGEEPLADEDLAVIVGIEVS